MFKDRKPLYEALEAKRGSKVIAYVTGDRSNLGTQIAAEVFDFFVNHLDIIGVTPKISLYLYTRGGSTLAAWSIVNLLRQFTDDLEVVIPHKCHSAGTLMSLGANRIVMTKQATLGPIDPSINGSLNPLIEGAGPQARVPVSVEAVMGYLELAKGEVGIKNDESLSNILLRLSDKVHPLVLGEAYRSMSQIKMLARKLLQAQISDEATVNKVISFLCSESGSHDYTINRREAANQLGLKIDKPDQALYEVIKAIYDDFAQELQLNAGPFDPAQLVGQGAGPVQYSLRRGLVESPRGGSYYFCTEGQLQRAQIQLPQGFQGQIPGGMQLQDNRTFEGWKHENG